MSDPAWAQIDETHDPGLRSWVASAQGHPDFPIQNLPFGAFSPPDESPRGGVAIGDKILDLAALVETGALEGPALAAARVAASAPLNRWMALAPADRRALRRDLSAWLSAGRQGVTPPAQEPPLLWNQADCRLHLPVRIGDYTDFYAGIHHAENIGRLFRPDQPLLPNYKHVPIAYHGRASTVRPSGTAVRRPSGQLKPPDAAEPVFGPSRRLDYEVELGFWLGAANALGQPVPIRKAPGTIAGVSLLNDWSARDIQAWEYQPLGPFLAKNFLTTVSPWVVTAEALAPFRTAQAPRPDGDPAPLPYLWDKADQQAGALAIEIEVLLSTAQMRKAGRPPRRLAVCDARDLYWTAGQMAAHHSAGGCSLRPGDLFGSGTISGSDPGALGSLMELSQGGARPIAIADGESRTFLEDGDEVTFRGRCRAEGRVPIGFGDCAGQVHDR